jgi:lysozyme family protein
LILPKLKEKIMQPTLSEYQNLFFTAFVRPEKRAAIDLIVKRIVANKTRYQAVADRFNKMPWWFPAIVHQMEASGNFNRHLHNGDPLTHRTVQVPEGRPLTGAPPFTWEQSADDALRMKHFDAVSDWSMPNALWLLEKYNGMGYRAKGINTPYLWSYTNHYTKGKYIGDHRYDPNAVSGQAGAAAMLKVLQEKNLL